MSADERQIPARDRGVRRDRRPEPPPPVRAASARRKREQLLGALSSPGALRRAFLLREALAPPVSLRGQKLDRLT